MEQPKAKQGVYGAFRPQTAPVSRKPTEPLIEDVRHAEENPMPWLRYFFPKVRLPWRVGRQFDVHKACCTVAPAAPLTPLSFAGVFCRTLT